MVGLNTNRLTDEGIQAVLEQWPTLKWAVEGDDCAEGGNLWSVYQRLIEVYCVVKVGGVAVQVEAAQALLQRETASLAADMAALPPTTAFNRAALLRQEIQDLKNAVHWRIEQLQRISPEEEAVVRNAIAVIETRLLGIG